MKRYVLFIWAKWEPGGGWDDFVGVYSDLEEAKQVGLHWLDNTPSPTWGPPPACRWQVVDLTAESLTSDVTEEGECLV